MPDEPKGLAIVRRPRPVPALLISAEVLPWKIRAVLLMTLYLQEARGLSPLLTGLCFVPQAAGAFALVGPAGRLVLALGPPHPQARQPQHLFRHQAGGIP
jgi:hypothetical protein